MNGDLRRRHSHMEKREAARNWFVNSALSYLGTPYRWGGDDPSGFDCSGLVMECLKSVGIINRGDFSADSLWQQFADVRVDRPEVGCLVFRMNPNGRAVHVGICLDCWFQISAAGGTASVREEGEAWRNNAFVKIRPIELSGRLRQYCDPLLTIRE